MRTFAEAAQYAEVPLTELLEALDSAVLAYRSKRRATMEGSLRRAMQRVFRTQRGLMLHSLRVHRLTSFQEAVAVSDGDAWFNAVERDTHDAMLAPLQSHIGQAMQRGIVQQQADALGLAGSDLAKATKKRTFAAQDPRTLQYMQEHGAQTVTSINETTRKALRKVLAQGVEEGWPYPRTAKEIRNTFDGFAGLMPQAHIRDRAELVAKTEIANATEYGMMLSAQEMQATGLTMEHRWSTSGGACDICAPNPSVGWIPLDLAFPSGHMRAPVHPACSCFTATRIQPGTKRAA